MENLIHPISRKSQASCVKNREKSSQLSHGSQGILHTRDVPVSQWYKELVVPGDQQQQSTIGGHGRRASAYLSSYHDLFVHTAPPR